MEILRTQIKLIFIIFGDHFSPDEITRLIKVDPTNYWIKGDKIPVQKGLVRIGYKISIRQESCWEFSTNFIDTLDFEDVFLQFENIFKNKIPILKNYIQKNRLEAAINIVVEIVDGEKPSLHFNKQMIKFCEELGAEIDIDMYLLRND